MRCRTSRCRLAPFFPSPLAPAAQKYPAAPSAQIPALAGEPEKSMSRTPLHRVARVTASALICAGAVLGVSTVGAGVFAAPAHAHDELIGREVVTDADGAPEAIRLSFNNSILEVGTEVIVTAAEGGDITDGAPQVVGPDVLLPLARDLAPGEYAGAWRVVSSDGHPIEGRFVIVVAADGSATIGDAAADPAPDETTAAETSDGEGSDSGLPVGALIAVGVGGAAVIAGGMAVATIGRRRRAQGMAADAEQQDR